MTRKRTTGVAWMVLALLSGCTSEARTLVVDLRTDWIPGREFDQIEVEVFDNRGERIQGTEVRLSGTGRFLDGVRVAELQITGSEVVLRTSLLGPGGFRQAQLSRVSISAQRQAVTVLITRSCDSVVCDAPETTACLGGTCVPDRCSTEETAETCVTADRCLADTECSSSVLCVQPQCVAQVCLYDAQDSECALGLCDPDLGCVGAPEADAGIPDAGPPDAGEPDSGTCDTSPCRLVRPQCGCPDGLACQELGGIRACGTPGPSGENEPCEEDTDCAAGLFCVAPDGAFGLCQPYCLTSDDCGDERCLDLRVASEVGGCAQACNPLDGTGCGDPRLT